MSTSGGDLLANANASMQKEMDAEARAKLDATRAASNGGSGGGVMLASGKLASENAAAKGKLTTPSATPSSTPPTSGRLPTTTLKPPSSVSRLIMRKPATTTASSRLMKKSTAVASSKLRVNKLTTTNVGDDAFEDVETTQKAIEEQKKKEIDEQKRQEDGDAKLAQKLQDEMNGIEISSAISPTLHSAPVIQVVATPAEPPKPKLSAMEENMAKLSAMNSDFFSGM